MNKILKHVKNAFRSVVIAVAAPLLTLASCDSNPIYDYEGDCTVTYRLKFRYDLNLKWADAFNNEVRSVRLYAFGEDGVLVREFTEERESQLADPSYAMTLDLPAGRYRLLAWCGIDNPGAAEEYFAVPSATPGVTRIEELTCRINRTYPAPDSALCDAKRLSFMFHGDLEVELPADEDGGEYEYTMHLTKDTNHIRVMLQHLSGEDIDDREFDFRIEDANGFYAFDNALLPDDTLTYTPYEQVTGQAGIVRDDAPRTRGLIYAKMPIVDFMVGRVMADHYKDMILTITAREDGRVIAKIPLIQYALLGKPYYEEQYGHKMDEQEFLDRQDEYVMTFFLDQNLRWITTVVMIESWRIVLHDYDL